MFKYKHSLHIMYTIGKNCIVNASQEGVTFEKVENTPENHPYENDGDNTYEGGILKIPEGVVLHSFQFRGSTDDTCYQSPTKRRFWYLTIVTSYQEGINTDMENVVIPIVYTARPDKINNISVTIVPTGVVSGTFECQNVVVENGFSKVTWKYNPAPFTEDWIIKLLYV